MTERRPARPRHRLAALLSEVLVFAGLALLGYTAWTLWGTGLMTSDAQQAHRESLHEAWSESPVADADNGAPDPTDDAGPDDAERKGGLHERALALIRIPELGADWEWAVLEGTDPSTLAEGIGHESGTAAAGKVGNFVLAGHRATYGEPFARLPDEVGTGDRIEVETREATYVYRVTRTKQTTPYDDDAIAPVPGRPGVEPEQAMITLVTCTPRWGSSGRWIVFGELIDTVTKKEATVTEKEAP